MGFTEDWIANYNSKDEDRFVAQFAPDGRYSDVTMRLTYVGQDEIRRMIHSVFTRSYQDLVFTQINGISNDRFYAVEWSTTFGSPLDGNEYTVRAVSVGDLDEHGRIIENRDYWNPAHAPSGDPAALQVERDAWEALQKQ